MEITLLSIIAGLIALDLYFKNAVDKHGNSAKFNEILILLGMVLLTSAFFYGIAYLFK